MKKIKLTQNKIAIIDDNMYNVVNQYKWYAHKSGNNYYCERSNRVNGKWTTLQLHRFIMEQNGYDVKDKEIDHINGDGLDNRLENLRVCIHSENQRNRSKQKDNTSGYKGVVWHKRDKKWQTNIRVGNNKKLHIGYFENKIDAAKAYDTAAIKYHGEFANTNFPRENYDNSTN